MKIDTQIWWCHKKLWCLFHMQQAGERFAARYGRYRPRDLFLPYLAWPCFEEEMPWRSRIILYCLFMDPEFSDWEVIGSQSFVLQWALLIPHLVRWSRDNLGAVVLFLFACLRVSVLLFLFVCLLAFERVLVCFILVVCLDNLFWGFPLVCGYWFIYVYFIVVMIYWCDI